MKLWFVLTVAACSLAGYVDSFKCFECSDTDDFCVEFSGNPTIEECEVLNPKAPSFCLATWFKNGSSTRSCGNNDQKYEVGCHIIEGVMSYCRCDVLDPPCNDSDYKPAKMEGSGPTSSVDRLAASGASFTGSVMFVMLKLAAQLQY